MQQLSSQARKINEEIIYDHRIYQSTTGCGRRVATQLGTCPTPSICLICMPMSDFSWRMIHLPQWRSGPMTDPVWTLETYLCAACLRQNGFGEARPYIDQTTAHIFLLDGSTSSTAYTVGFIRVNHCFELWLQTRKPFAIVRFNKYTAFLSQFFEDIWIWQKIHVMKNRPMWKKTFEALSDASS